MTTVQENFLARLEPERTIDDLDQRSEKALVVLGDAAAVGDWELIQRALARCIERWAERETLAPAPAWLWQRRHHSIEAAIQRAPAVAVAAGTEALAALWHAWYHTAARGGGMTEAEATAYADERVANWRLLEESAAYRDQGVR